MSSLSNRTPDFFSGSDKGANSLESYIQSLSPEAIAQLSRPEPEVMQAMERNIVGMLGNLPSENFGVMITTSRDQLGRLLASAMMSGYFLNNVQQRRALERSLQAAPDTNS